MGRDKIVVSFKGEGRDGWSDHNGTQGAGPFQPSPHLELDL